MGILIMNVPPWISYLKNPMDCVVIASDGRMLENGVRVTGKNAKLILLLTDIRLPRVAS